MKITFRLRYDSHWGEELFLTGNHLEMGLWNPDDAVAMRYVAPATWETTLRIDKVQNIEYKYLIKENGGIRWEEGDNRRLSSERASVWDWFGSTQRRRRLGVAVPIFSLRSEESLGIGEYADLKKMADWCVAIGLDLIQILPVNDTTAWHDWRDSYPYNAISAFALNPIYLNLSAMGIAVDAEDIPQPQRNVDFPAVQQLKWRYFKIGFASDWETTKNSADYHLFFKDNEDWLLPYAAFCAQRDANNTMDAQKWSKVCDEKDVELYYYLQYHCDRQLRDACNYLHDKGLLLKGDIPIGVNPMGVDVYAHPELFHRDCQAGAPPDDFAAEGQNWGFPTYNWDAMEKDDYAWWRRRLQVMARYFDAFRIDHILGFFRIWEIPKKLGTSLLGHFKPALPLSKEEITASGFPFDAARHNDQGLDTLFISDPYQQGCYHPRIAVQKTESYKALTDSEKAAIDHLYEDFYFHRHNEFWKQHALKRLPAVVSATDMIACGEDLGMIPASVPEVMQQLNIMSLEVQRMPKIFGRNFVQNEDLPEHCVYTTGTHDMPTLRGWLEEDPERAKSFLKSLEINGEKIKPNTILKVLEKHLDSPAEWSIYPLQDLLDTDEKYWSEHPQEDQINVPADPNNHWCYRMAASLEQVLHDDALNAILARMMK